jgi:hypothetical protein
MQKSFFFERHEGGRGEGSSNKIKKKKKKKKMEAILMCVYTYLRIATEVKMDE